MENVDQEYNMTHGKENERTDKVMMGDCEVTRDRDKWAEAQWIQRNSSEAADLRDYSTVPSNDDQCSNRPQLQKCQRSMGLGKAWGR